MKKTLLLTLALLISVTTFAQSRATLLSETFDSKSLPSGWKVMDKGTNNWSIKNTDKAGGKANELDLYWDPRFEGISRMVMSPIDLTDIQSIVVSFKHYLDYYPYYSGVCTIGIATSSDQGETWNTGWSQEYDKTDRYVINEVITTPDMGNPDVLICLYFEGNTDNINSWQFDDILIFSQEKNDAELLSVDVSNNLGNGYNEVSFTIKNLGTATIETFEAKYQVEGSETFVSETFNTNLEPFGIGQFTFEKANMFSMGNVILNIEVTSVNGENDNFIDNNSSSKEILVGMGTAQRIPMIEHFSSSTCWPCVFTNKEMDTLTHNNPGKYTYVKYPMNGPESGDPYYISDCNTRRGYYNVNNVPTLFLDGTAKFTDAIPQEKLDKSYNGLSFFDIRGSFNIEGNNINVIVDLMSYIDIKGVKVYVSVNEKTTTENIGSNGETEFHHILMKLLQSAGGIKLDMEAGKHQRLDLSYDMTTTNVEDMNDLEVAVWIQNPSTKEIYNSRFAYEYCEHVEPVQNLTAEIVGDYLTLVVNWDAPAINTPIGYNVLVDGKLVAENINELDFIDEYQELNVYDGQPHFVEIVAVYEDGKTSLGAICKIIDVFSIEESTTATCNIYPNPADDRIYIDSDFDSDFVIYNINGQQVHKTTRQQGDGQQSIDVSKLNAGIYFIEIKSEKGNIVKRFIKN